MKQYYDTRAPEYDEWYRGEGAFARRDRPCYGHLEPAERARVLNDGSSFQVFKRYFEAEQLLAELTGSESDGRVVFDSSWFVAAAVPAQAAAPIGPASR